MNTKPSVKEFVPMSEFDIRVGRALKRAAEKALAEDRRFGISSELPVEAETKKAA